MDQDKIRLKSERYFDEVAKKNAVIDEPARCYPVVLDELPLPCGTMTDFTVADIGCGTGEMLWRLESKYRGCQTRIVGVDLSEESLKKAGEKCTDDVELYQGDAENLPFADEEFDALLCMHSFHHYPNPLKALQEMQRILKAGGTLYLVENDLPELKRKLQNLRLKIMRYPNGDMHMYAEEELNTLAGQAGLSVTASRHIAEHSRLMKYSKVTGKQV